ncbi:LLM class flavin-dependent oxidoreductase [Amycolatopsis jejuensis]|uniref:LLM class flavin-dependent oxidoreductase n=1 Tax=Amycolatopsis jejuensis TaxID=330084 RepID=UPI0005251D35|nr:LLM class flavin-dependent oxidoreductase [Amycolatopsis jejuensis]
MTSSAVHVGVRFPPAGNVAEVAGEVARAERFGFDTAWIADSQLLWRDVWVAMGLAAARTERITLASAVTNLVTRLPSVVASAVNTVAELAPGRVWLGLGTGDSSVKPIGLSPSTRAQLRTGLTEIRRLLDGDPVPAGNREVYLQGAGGRVPVHIAASGPRMVRMAGEVADGVLTLAGISPETVAKTVAAVREGASGRAMPVVTAGAFCALTDDVERDARVLKPICLHMATIGAQDFLRLAGIELPPPPPVPDVYPDMVHAVDWEDAITLASRYVSDEAAVRFAQTFCLFGTADEIVEQAQHAVDAGATGFYLRHVGNYTLPSELITDFGEQVLPRLQRLVPRVAA